MHEQDRNGEPKMELPIPIKTTGLSMEAHEMLESIARRAYETFESKGRVKGREVENWLQAETELFAPMPIDVRESQEGVTVFAEVAGFTPKELEVELEPKRLVIVGKRQSQVKGKAGRAFSSRKSTTQLLRTLQLPVEIDTLHATARLNRGILEIDVKKKLTEELKTIQA